jgi:hypothetical protein
VGDTVYYHPEGRGPYPDLTAAIDDVPRGGLLQLDNAVYNVAEEGRLLIDKPMHVRGVGWSKPAGWWDNTSGRVFFGTVIKNLANPSPELGDSKEKRTAAIEKPTVEIAIPAPESHGGLVWNSRATLRDLGVRGATDSFPTVLVNNTIRTFIADTNIMADPVKDVDSQTSEALRYQGQSFFATNSRNVINGNGFGIRVVGSGYAYAFYDNHVSARWGEPGIALDTNVDRTIVIGGEYTGKTGIRFWNGNTGKNLKGGLVLEPGFENNPEQAVAIGTAGDGTVEGVQLYHNTYSMWLEEEESGGVGTAVRFGNAQGCKLIQPIVWNRSETVGNLVEWSENAGNCGLITDATTLRKSNYADEGSRNPYVSVTGSATDEDLQAFPTGVPTTVEYGVDAGVPVLHDGLGWRRAAEYPSYSPGN